MTTFGTITEFHGTSQDSTSYEVRLMCYFEVNGITVEKKRSAIFLSVVGDEIYTLLRGLVAHKSPRDIKLDEILKYLAKHFTPDTNTIVERYWFYNWTRSSGQSIKSCIAQLKNLDRL